MANFPLRPTVPGRGPLPGPRIPRPGPGPVPPGPVPSTFNLSNNAGIDATQGDTVTFTLTGPNGTYDYLIGGVAPGEVSVPLDGQITIRNGVGFLRLTIAEDAQILLGEELTLTVVTGISQGQVQTVVNEIPLVSDVPPGPVPVPGKTFTLTTDINVVPASDGFTKFVGNNRTLQASDNLSGAIGGDNTLEFTTNENANIAGFTTNNIQNYDITAINGNATLDLFLANGLQDVVNKNSNSDVTLNNVKNIVTLGLQNILGGATSLNYTAAALAGGADVQTVVVDNIQSVQGGAAGIIELDSNNAGVLETVSLTAAGGASQLLDIVGDGTTRLNIAGAANLTIAERLDGFTTINASTYTGNLSVVADSGALAVAVTGGAGNDRADFSAGFGAGDSFNGGGGVNTLIVTNQVATAAGPGTLTNVQSLAVSTAGTGNIDLDNFAGVGTVDYTVGLGGATGVIDTAASASVEVDNTFAGNNLTVAQKVDGAADSVNLTFNGATNAEGSRLGTVTANQAETVSITTNLAAAGNGGAFRITDLQIADATTLNLAGNSPLTLVGATVAATPLLTTLNAGTATGNLTIGGVNTSANGATITFGSGNDIYNVATSNGADVFNLGSGGTDTISYTAVAQSSGTKVDTINNFVNGDIINLQNLGGVGAGVVASNQFLGNFPTFAAAQGAITAANQAVFQQDANTLWVNSDGNNVLNGNDFRVVLSGVNAITAQNLGLNIVGNNIQLTAPLAVVSLTEKVNATATSTNEDDTITTTYANLNRATLNGALGVNTLTVTTNSAALTRLNDASADNRASLTNIQNVVLNEVNGVVNLGANIPATVKNLTLNGASAGLTATTTGDNQTFRINNTSGTNVATVTLTNNAGLVVDTGEAADVINAVQTADASVTTRGGDDNIKVSAVAGAGALLDGGTGVNTLTIDANIAAATTFAFTRASNFGALVITEDDSNVITTSLLDGITALSTIAVNNDFDVVVNGTAAQITALTALDVVADTTLTLQTVGAGNIDLTDLNLSRTTFNAAAPNDFINVVTVDSDNLTQSVKINGDNNNDTLQLTQRLNAAGDLDDVVDFGIINLTGNAQDLTTADALVTAGAATTINATTLTGALTFNALAEDDAILNLNGTNFGDTITYGGANTAALRSQIVAGTRNDLINFGTLDNNGDADGLQGALAVNLAAGGDDILRFNTLGAAANDRSVVDLVTGFNVGTTAALGDSINFSIGDIFVNTAQEFAAFTANADADPIAAAIARGAVTVTSVAAGAGDVNVTASTELIKLTSTTATSFANAIQGSAVVVTNNANSFTAAADAALITFYDDVNDQAVVGYVLGNATTKITGGDVFNEVARLDMTAADYANFGTNQFAFIA